MEKKTVRQASGQYDMIKVITTFLVVVAHAARMYTGEGVVQPCNSSAFWNGICNIIYSFHMPLYICVSGMVYGLCIDGYGKYEDALDFIKNKFMRLIIPYFFFGIIYVAPVMVMFHFTDKTYVGYCISGILLVKDSRHLWFLVVLFEIFCVCALAKKKIQKVNPAIVFAILFVAVILSMKMPNILQMKKMIYYLPFFYLGYVINKNYEFTVEILRKPIVIFILAAMWAGSRLLPVGGKIVSSLAGIGIIIGLVQYIDLRIAGIDIFQKICKNGFGIYLLHPMIIYILFYFFGKYDINPVLLCSVIILFSFSSSYILTGMIRKTCLRVFIGE